MQGRNVGINDIVHRIQALTSRRRLYDDVEVIILEMFSKDLVTGGNGSSSNTPVWKYSLRFASTGIETFQRRSASAFDMLERDLLFLLNSFPECADSLSVLDFDREDMTLILAENPK
jgi:hypothetical protein